MKKVLLALVGVSALVFAAAAIGAGAVRVYTMARGDGANVVGTRMTCGVGVVQGKTLITCFVRNNRTGKPQANTYALSLTEQLARVVRLTPDGKGKVVFSKRH